MSFALIFCVFTWASAETSPTKIIVKSSREKAGLSVNQNAKTFSDELYFEEPNLSFAGGTNRPRYLQIRGVGETSSYENTPTHSVGYFINGIDLTGVIASWPSLNLEGTSVYKGPQSVTFGSSAIGGVVENKISSDFEHSQALLAYQSAESKQAGVEVNIFDISKLFLYYNDQQGFYKNTANGSAGAAQEEYYVSLYNDYVHNSLWKINSSHLGLKTNNNFDMWSLSNTYKTLSDQPGKDAQEINGHALRIEKGLHDEQAFVSVSSVTFSSNLYSYDADWSSNPSYDYFDEYQRRRTAWHQKWFWQKGLSQAGLHFYGLEEKSEIKNFKNKNLRRDLNSRFQSQAAALFTNAHWDFSTDQSLQIGGRYEVQKISYNDSNLPLEDWDYSFWAAQIEWQKRISEHSLFFAKVSRGFKNAGVNVDDSIPQDLRFYKPEYAINYEVGFHRETETSSTSTTLFFADQTEKQVKVSRQDDPTDPSSYTYYTSNAARVQATGLEAAFQQRHKAWRFEGKAGLLYSTFHSYIFENRSLDGRKTAASPVWSYAFGVTHLWGERFSANLTTTGQDAFYFSNNHDQKSSPYNLLNAGFSSHINAWTFDLWIKNIFNTHYATRGFYFANEPPDWQNKLYLQFGNPRVIGGSMRYQF